MAGFELCATSRCIITDMLPHTMSRRMLMSFSSIICSAAQSWCLRAVHWLIMCRISSRIAGQRILSSSAAYPAGAANSRSVAPVGWFVAFPFALIADLSRSVRFSRRASASRQSTKSRQDWARSGARAFMSCASPDRKPLVLHRTRSVVSTSDAEPCAACNAPVASRLQSGVS